MRAVRPEMRTVSLILLALGRPAFALQSFESFHPLGSPEMTLLTMARQDGGTPHPISGNGPESLANVLDYEIQQPTPPPAEFNGVYCRGSACQYRVPPPPVTLPPVTPFPNIPYGLNKREFCRGLSCFPMMGWPLNKKMDDFRLNCAHLFNDVAGGLSGPPHRHNVDNVKQTFINWCLQRIEPLQVGKCPGLADVAVMGVAANIGQPGVGDVLKVCEDLFNYIESVKVAEVDLKMVKSALPKAAGASLISIELNHFGTGGVGPDSPRGRRFKQHMMKHRRNTLEPKIVTALLQEEKEESGKEGKFLHKSSTSCKTSTRAAKEDPPANFDDRNRGLPRYDQNAPCDSGVQYVPQSGTKYQILPGSPDGIVGPVEIDGDLFSYCQTQMAEIMLGFDQYGYKTIGLTKDWCSWQASITDWIGKKGELGHPDWDFRNCNNMAGFVGYALRNLMDVGLGAGAVCEKMFLAKGAVHKVDSLVQDAWVASLRAGPDLGLSTDVDDAAMKEALAKAQAYAKSIYDKLRGQKEAFDNLNTAKMDTSAFDKGGVKSPDAANVAKGPGLPNSADFDMKSFIFLGSSLHRWGVQENKTALLPLP